MITKKAYAKVNLFLNVTGKQSDGYHTLEMINAKINLADTITISSIDLPHATIIVSNDIFLSTQDNIVHDLAAFMMRTFVPEAGIKIEIDKQIPFGAGLGGNSADCAAIIHIVDDLFELNLSEADKIDIGLRYGADIPYCLYDGTALVRGIGERVTPLDVDWSEYKVLLVHPRQYISTKSIFSLGDKEGFNYRDIEPALAKLTEKDIEGFSSLCHNSLQEIVLNSTPELRTLAEEMTSQFGSKGLVMTGSGSTFIKLLRRGEKTDSRFIARLRANYFVDSFDFK
ncbi:MAG: 4-(cytidine 5'-diphospho)-2-C-methyl-D-erythritol kinase [Candidatus Izemoplasmatales bacterium]|nr:4-(cytidine 5'-diphospho)-2-C-methyl-D-erythritol kinase [Candidatus Izemoplasmatales bacterium]